MVLAVLLCASSSPVAAQELVLEPWVLAVGVEEPPAELLDPPGVTYPRLLPGDKAPFDGRLLDTETAARWVAVRVWYQKQLKLDADALRDVMRKQHTAAVALRVSDTASYKREIMGLRQDLRDQAKAFTRAKKVPFYKTWAFGLVCGIVLSGAIAAGSTYAATK